MHSAVHVTRPPLRAGVKTYVPGAGTSISPCAVAVITPLAPVVTPTISGSAFAADAATVAGDIKYLLKNIINIENEEKLTTSGISPHIWINELSITGDE